MAKATGLSPKDLEAAKATAGRFLQAVVAGDEATARSLLIVREGENVDFKAMHETTASYELGEPTAEADGVVVVAAIHAPEGREGSPSIPMVLAMLDGAWKIDMGASVKRLLGGLDLEGLMKRMAEGLGTAVAGAMEGVAQALSAGKGGPPPAASPPRQEEPEGSTGASSGKRRRRRP